MVFVPVGFVLFKNFADRHLTDAQTDPTIELGYAEDRLKRTKSVGISAHLGANVNFLVLNAEENDEILRIVVDVAKVSNRAANVVFASPEEVNFFVFNTFGVLLLRVGLRKNRKEAHFRDVKKNSFSRKKKKISRKRKTKLFFERDLKSSFSREQSFQ